MAFDNPEEPGGGYTSFGYVIATFFPIRRDDLLPEMQAFIGRRGLFQGPWIIEQQSPCAGQLAWELPVNWRSPGAWALHCDLAAIEAVGQEEGHRLYFEALRRGCQIEEEDS